MQIKAGCRVIIPKGTVHRGSRASPERFRTPAITLPPQRPEDTVAVP